jgi:GNAT superfamily N-acetyltransferase
MPSAPLRLMRWPAPSRDAYRTLFTRVGAPWLWFSRLVIADAALDAIITDPAVHIYAVVDQQGIEVGMLELDFRTPGQCEIAYFALIPELAGKGYGRWLMAQAKMLGWVPGIDRLWVHTCTLDHPSALNFYRAQGFTAISRAVETFPDPRLGGQLPDDSAPQIPMI